MPSRRRKKETLDAEGRARRDLTIGNRLNALRALRKTLPGTVSTPTGRTQNPEIVQINEEIKRLSLVNQKIQAGALRSGVSGFFGGLSPTEQRFPSTARPSEGALSPGAAPVPDASFEPPPDASFEIPGPDASFEPLPADASFELDQGPGPAGPPEPPSENREERYLGSGVQGVFEDATPLEPGSEEDDLMRRLTDAVLNPRRDSPVHIPFSRGDMIALGILGGVSDDAFKNVVLPLIQGDRLRTERDADRRVIQEQQELRALEALTQLRGQQDQRRFTQAVQEQQLNLQQLSFLSLSEQREFNRLLGIETLRLKERALDIRELGIRARLHRKIPAGDAAKVGVWLEVVTALDDLQDNFFRSRGGTGGFTGTEVPGGPIESPAGFAMTEAQTDFRAALQAQESEIRNKIFGAAFTENEAKIASRFIPEFGGLDKNVKAGVMQLRNHALGKFRGYLNGWRATGYDTTGMEALGRSRGLSEEELGLIGPIGFMEMSPSTTPAANQQLPGAPPGVEWVGFENDYQLVEE